MNEEIDILVVGGGPAGLAAGIASARNGLRTVVCEKRKYPVEKPCGEGIMPTGVRSLKKLGISQALPPDDFFEFAGIRYISNSGRSAQAEFREGSGWGVDRKWLSAAMLKTAGGYPLLEVIDGEKVIGLETPPGRLMAATEHGCYYPRLVIAADGLNSAIRSRLKADRPAAKRRWGIRQHFQVAPWSRFVEVYWGMGIEAYVTPVSPGSVNVAFLWDRGWIKPVRGGREMLAECLDRFPALKDHLVGAKPLDIPASAGPLERGCSTRAAEGVLFIGDSAGYVDAITGEGISLALETVLLFEKLIIPQLIERRDKISFIEYQKGAQDRFRSYERMARLALFFTGKPRLTEAVIGLLRLQPAIFQFLLSINMGNHATHV